MGLLRRIFGTNGTRDTGSAPLSSQFQEADSSGDEETSRNAPRRELIQVILRDTMRKHGIPSDWIECRVLSAVNRSGRSGLHVNFVVRQAHDRLLGYVFAFQDSFETELARFEPRAKDWLMSLGWEFRGHNLSASMPDPKSWAGSGHAPLAPMGSTAPLVDRGFAADDGLQMDAPKSDEDVQRDLKALFAIRDAAIADAAGKVPSAPEGPDFEPTQPFEDSDPTRRG